MKKQLKEFEDEFFNVEPYILMGDEMLDFLESSMQAVRDEERESGIQITKDGNKHSALMGENIQEGNCGFGDTISEALRELANDIEDNDIPLHIGEFTNVEKVDYSKQNKEARIVFSSGEIYIYTLPFDIWKEWVKRNGKGSFFNREIVNIYPHRKLSIHKRRRYDHSAEGGKKVV